MFEWLHSAKAEYDSGDMIDDVVRSGERTRIAEGEIDSRDDHPVLLKKYARTENGETSWIVRVEVPDGPEGRYNERTFGTEFTADAVFEKLKREYDLEKWEPEDDE